MFVNYRCICFIFTYVCILLLKPLNVNYKPFDFFIPKHVSIHLIKIKNTLSHNHDFIITTNK